MPDSCTHLYVHFIWATWNRTPLLVSTLREPIYACISDKCYELRCQLIEIGGIEDHVHVLVRLHSTVAVAVLAKGMKGSSSHLATHALNQEFKWQGGYGALTVSLSHVRRVCRYIQRQSEHHAQGSIWPELEKITEDDD
ncbi:MAG: IS200/IS605 family transposase [Armatimonadota bacterium]|nr:IS200/IS605 family transposase [Armatimonadota bacterium]